MDIYFNYIASLWETDKEPYVKASTMALYRIILRCHLLPFFGPMKEVTEKDAQEFVLSSLSSGMARKTVKDCITLLKSILRFGYTRKFCDFPAWNVKYPSRERNTDAEVLTREEYVKLAKFCRENFSFRRLGIYIALSTGLRIGEVCALQWKDIDRDRKVVSVSKTVESIPKDGKYLLTIGSPKTPSSNREVPIPRMLRDYLQPFLKVMNPEHFVVSADAGPLDPKILRKEYKKVCSLCGIRSLKFHALRHSYATRLIEAGSDYKTVSVLLGHASISTTMNLYVHPGLEQKRKAVSKLDSWLK